MNIRKRILEIHKESISADVAPFNRIYKKYPLINEAIIPCHFSGDIEAAGKIVTISLNPKYTSECTENEQSGFSLDEWYDFCRYRFSNYPCDTAVHRTFKNIRKLFVPPHQWRESSCRSDLQQSLVNLDWCPYYSGRFPTISPDRPAIVGEMMKRWDKVLDEMVHIVKPPLIFVHGKTMESWVSERVVLKKLCVLKTDRGNRSHVWHGQFNQVPLVYLEYGITQVGNNDALAQLGDRLRNLPRIT